MIQNFVEDIEKTIASSKIVLTSNIEKYFGPSMETVYLKGRVLIIDTSIFEIAVLAEESRQKVIIEKYRLHYMDAAGKMWFRYDNAPHHSEIGSYPHHKHLRERIIPAAMPSIKDVLEEISAVILQSPA